MVDKKVKPNTEKINEFKEFFMAAWGNIAKEEYTPFVKWHRDDNGSQHCVVEFTSDSPSEYTNKWDRNQLKISCICEGQESVLSAGKRLFIQLKAFCIENLAKPTDLGLIKITRYGSGFDTNYKLEKTES